MDTTDSQVLLKRMIVSVINAREIDSNKISRLLHDEIGQVLSAVGLQLDVLKLDYKAQLPEIVSRVNEIQTLLDQSVQQVRALSYDLNPAVVERAGLQAALERLVGRFREGSKAAVRLLYDTSVRVPVSVGNAWYRIAELAIENSLRHGAPGKIEVQVRTKQGQAVMEVRDDGAGFSLGDAQLSWAGLGLMLMEHYSSQSATTLEIKTAPGKGTIVRTVYRDQGNRDDAV